MTTELEAFAKVKAALLLEIDAQERATEARRVWYEKKGSELLHKPTDVKFKETLLDEFGEPLHGCVEILNGRYVVLIKSCLPIERERFVFCHELGHVKAGHVIKDITPIESEKAKITIRAVLSGRIDQATGINAKKIYQDEYAKCEHEADEIGWLLYRYLWPE
jgi:hypothetical protein